MVHPDNRSTRRDDVGEAGFTLVEVLVSLTLLALMSTIMLGGFQFGARSWDRVSTVSAERDRVYATHAFLRQRLGSLSLPSGLAREVDETTLPIVGNETMVSFLASWQTGPVVSGLYLFRLWHDDSDGGRLMLSWQQLVGTETGGGEGTRGERVLLDGVAQLQLGYFGTTREAPGGLWASNWDTRAGGLRLLKLEVQFSDPRRHWPVLMVAPGM
ncbi:prepilin-type N-terminal cleavage/methylation domain-containing protein [Marimonas arenosa]|uniref:Prepilin-type N-terminal cleavage/methylation domain-containing protein n=1 Tax=Marimonas arenosa TaxID=1795305 RepID=A0AAE3WFT1_9RHOB|nr:prepilin-type N-terminal cleavage/methylation domain-containing protein [Marimonas arenosa]MDQ2090853.1 prepilin-type N-terminal cleavage/methylation domain-containing protein [Marimonas arenosa]